MWFYVKTKKSLLFIELYTKPVEMEHYLQRFPRKLAEILKCISTKSFDDNSPYYVNKLKDKKTSRDFPRSANAK